MNIGNEIKRLRKLKGLSQNELAEVLHVTAQSVSKWESDTSYPDINQLPAIASFFGITIDELFVYPTDLEYERIEKSIENGNPLSNDVFVHSEEFLLEEIKKNPENHRAVSMLGDLYHFEACRLNDKAVHYAMDALRMKPDNKFDLNTLNNASNGYINDWNISCHYKLIEKLYLLVRNNPANSDRTKLFLLDNLIADGRFEEATRILEENPGLKLHDIYKVMMEEKQHGFQTAKTSYYELIEKNPDKWEILMEAANRLAFNGEYQDAINAYEKAFEVAPKPRYTDMLACIAWLNRCIGNKKAATEAYKRELLLLKEEWGITKGEQVDTLKLNIELLENTEC
ncbi:MAG: helix-turn-helix domain-containing protein [Roseburia sp.]|nr:helix-turn-helix domain-containing protein [Roseburia sp.]